jgi:hypothetical protein
VNFLHAEFRGGPQTTVVVTIDSQCNVMLLSDTDFAAYRSGLSFQYYGGWATPSRVHLVPPRYGHWHVVVDLGGRAGAVRAAVQVVGRARQVAV